VSGGYILLHRSVFDSERFAQEPFTEREAWIWMLTQASYQPHRIRYHNRMITVGRGEVPTSYRRLQEQFRWGVHRVYNFLNLLNNEGMITRKIETGFLIITICNYEKYQSSLTETATDTATVSATLPATDTATNRNKGQLKDNKRELNIPPVSPKPKPHRVSLEELSLDHIRDWLAEKRSQGKYRLHDESFVLEYFKNHCESNGKKYANPIAALRNAFEWQACQPKRDFQKSSDQPSPKPTGGNRVSAALAGLYRAGNRSGNQQQSGPIQRAGGPETAGWSTTATGAREAEIVMDDASGRAAPDSGIAGEIVTALPHAKPG